MDLILHITTREQWEQAKSAEVYVNDTLDTESFIHCSTPEQVIRVANAFYRAKKGLVLLCIETGKLLPELRYEAPPGAEGAEDFYPHIYGPLNLDAVIRVVDFEPDENGNFERPDGMAS